MLALLLVAAALGLSNFAAAIGLGAAGVDGRTRVRVGVVFGVFETGMPILGLALGHRAARALGVWTSPIGAGLLIATGLYTLVQAWRGQADQAGRFEQSEPGQSGQTRPTGPTGVGLPLGRLVVTGLALSVDNLAVGFALGAYRVDVLTAACVIGVVSVAMSLVGLEFGDRIGARTGGRGEWVGGLVLVGVGIAVACGVL